MRIPAAPPPLPGVSLPLVATVPDFTKREFALRERMDGPCTYVDWLAASLDLAQVNRLTRAYAPTLRFLERVVAARGVGYQPLHVVDAGCGHGDVLRRVARWATQRSVPVRLTGIDSNPYAARGARECDRKEQLAAKTIEWMTADVFAVSLPVPADVLISSLFTHHLADEQIVQLLRWQETTTRWGWMVNDLRRSERAAKVFGWMCRVMPWHSFLRHDGPVSIRRAFLSADWHGMIADAAIADAVVVERGTRLCVERVRNNISTPC